MNYGKESSTNIGGDVAVWEDGSKENIGTIGIEHHLIYGGFTGDTIKLYYTEFAVNSYQKIARGAFNMSFEYDLSKSKNIAYRDIEIKIIEANNKEIRFIIIKGPKKITPKIREEIIYKSNDY